MLKAYHGLRIPSQAKLRAPGLRARIIVES